MPETLKKDYPFQITWHQEIAYAMTDKDFNILANNDAISQWVESRESNLVGQSLLDVFPEFIGVEDDLRALHDNPKKRFVIPQIQRPSLDEIGRFFDIHAEPLFEPDAGFLIIISDVTKQTTQAQRLQQQRNELRLLSARLTASNEQLAYLLKRIIPRSVAQKLIDENRMPRLGVEGRSDVTILFADMRNFTAVAEGLGPEQTLHVLNAYLEVVASAIWRHQGNVIQIVGDMVMAAFNAPDPLPNHPLHAVRAALDVCDSLKRFINQARTEKLPALGFGLGIYTGQVTTGYLGVENRFHYSVIGDTTNVASHLCSRAKAGQIIIGQPTLDRLTGLIETIPLGETRLKQRRATLMLHELVGLNETSSNGDQFQSEST
jgi:adenylate cyclase